MRSKEKGEKKTSKNVETYHFWSKIILPKYLTKLVAKCKLDLAIDSSFQKYFELSRCDPVELLILMNFWLLSIPPF